MPGQRDFKSGSGKGQTHPPHLYTKFVSSWDEVGVFSKKIKHKEKRRCWACSKTKTFNSVRNI
jgi:hypothetical protein